MYALRDRLRPFQPRKPSEPSEPGREARCGWCRIAGDVALVYQPATEDAPAKAWWKGSLRCGSLWVCPACALAIRTARAEELNRIQAEWSEQGGRVLLATFTIAHAKAHTAAETVEGVQSAFRRLRQSTRWRTMRATSGYIGDVRGLEITHGGNGWHPHVHCLLFVTDEADENEIALSLGEAWQIAVEAEMGPEHVPNDEHGTDVRDILRTRQKKAGYLAKLGLELSFDVTKAAKLGNRTPWEIARDLCASATDNVADRWLWLEYAHAMKGRKQLNWSQGKDRRWDLRARFQVDERTDQEIVDGETTGEVALLVPGRDWDRIVRCVGVVHGLLELAQREGPRAVALWFAFEGTETRRPPPVAEPPQVEAA